MPIAALRTLDTGKFFSARRQSEQPARQGAALFERKGGAAPETDDRASGAHTAMPATIASCRLIAARLRIDCGIEKSFRAEGNGAPGSAEIAHPSCPACFACKTCARRASMMSKQLGQQSQRSQLPSRGMSNSLLAYDVPGGSMRSIYSSTRSTVPLSIVIIQTNRFERAICAADCSCLG